MENFDRMSDSEIVMELGRQYKEYRLQHRYTQQEAADRAGVSVLTLRRFENGQAFNLTMTNFLALLRGVGQLHGVRYLLPEIPESPYFLAEMEAHKPKRIRHGKQS